MLTLLVDCSAHEIVQLLPHLHGFVPLALLVVDVLFPLSAVVPVPTPSESRESPVLHVDTTAHGKLIDRRFAVQRLIVPARHLPFAFSAFDHDLDRLSEEVVPEMENFRYPLS